MIEKNTSKLVNKLNSNWGGNEYFIERIMDYRINRESTMVGRKLLRIGIQNNKMMVMK